MFDVQKFKLCYPVFNCVADEQIQCIFEEVCSIFNEFSGLTEPKKTTALNLAVAHFLYLRTNPIAGAGGAIASIGSQDDRIAFSVPYNSSETGGSFNLNATQYGAALKMLLRNNYFGGVVSRGYYTGCGCY